MYLWHKMVDGCTSYYQFKENKIKFITFNYDRSLEYFFVQRILNFFPEQEEFQNINNIFKIIPIYHVFGKVGNFHWESEVSRNYTHELGNYSNYHEIGKELRTIYEIESTKELDTIKDIVHNADEVQFFGFGYNDFNLRLLDVQNWPENLHISGTRYKLSDREVGDVNKKLNNKLESISKHQNHDCLLHLKEGVSFTK